ncbi:MULTISPECIES: hypothetical protein [Streptomyces]|uniref:Uncharacterized protein n=1 Tax=Streptomyces clavifer TaxID=68188 RepID=A0ABS4VBX6_9ACTN|nr:MULTISPECIES: hypothetical protein [Streptomyces]KQX78816.1 hypothetical protein ASD26_09870 [Streptomyces sp. Root1319]KQZ03842.1 hypothetical protein ASD51_18675 [Streptomyces sp. Root55]MBP2361149.1 hypothetical protein [Streptomyces clavifer]MDX2746219.1 hypothetical protein [Streptomyces sp. NRRL_B-2557]WRY82298.1 hypothetical protein OG388_14195 [Streptomyces clavifer]
MSAGGNNYNFGDIVNMHGGSGNYGIVKGQTTPGTTPSEPPALEAAVRELLVLVHELRDQVSPLNARTIDDSVSAIDGDAGAPPEDRHRALLAVAGIAATVGTVGEPVLEAVNRILELLGVK